MSSPTEAIQSRNGRVDRYRQLVRPIALHYARCCPEPLDDLIQVGLLGLLRAAECFAETSHTPFEAYARPHIRGAILHYLRDRLQPIRLPRRLQEQLDQRRSCLRQALIRSGRIPSDDELRREMGLSTMQWDRLEQARQLGRMLPLAAEMDVAAEDAGPALAENTQTEQRALEALDDLDPSLAEVVRRVVLSGWSYRRTAGKLKVSPMTVQRRLRKGLALLRQHLDQAGDPPAAAPASRSICRSRVMMAASAAAS